MSHSQSLFCLTRLPHLGQILRLAVLFSPSPRNNKIIDIVFLTAIPYLKLLHLVYKCYINYEVSRKIVFSGKKRLGIFDLFILTSMANHFEEYYFCQPSFVSCFLIFTFILREG
jgi:hypothetical protein